MPELPPDPVPLPTNGEVPDNFRVFIQVLPDGSAVISCPINSMQRLNTVLSDEQLTAIDKERLHIKSGLLADTKQVSQALKKLH